VLFLTMHHAVSDGWSIGVLVRELSQLYAAFRAGEPSPLPELAIQYADFAPGSAAGSPARSSSASSRTGRTRSRARPRSSRSRPIARGRAAARTAATAARSRCPRRSPDRCGSSGDARAPRSS
jgi:hypothetical protein